MNMYDKNVTCPSCGAEPGKQCRGGKLHGPRKRAWLQHCQENNLYSDGTKKWIS